MKQIGLVSADFVRELWTDSGQIVQYSQPSEKQTVYDRLYINL